MGPIPASRLPAPGAGHTVPAQALHSHIHSLSLALARLLARDGDESPGPLSLCFAPLSLFHRVGGAGQADGLPPHSQGES